MKARAGQVAVYLVATLLVIAILILANVKIFLAVRGRTRAMNAADAAALAVARYQGELLNQIGSANVEHLKYAIRGDALQCGKIVANQIKTCFLLPLEGIRIGNNYAKKNGAPLSPEGLRVLERHVTEIESLYRNNLVIYPEPYPGAWTDYANELRLLLADGVYAIPNNINFVDLPRHGFLLNKEFYSAIAGRVWCWFKYNAPGLLERYSSFRDWAPAYAADIAARQRACVNSEIYSLGLCMRQGRALDFLTVADIVRLTGFSAEEVQAAPLLKNELEYWFFFDTDVWSTWTNLSPNAPVNFPAYGNVLSHYDVRGCGASCGVLAEIVDVFGNFGIESVKGPIAEAKPLGTLVNDRREKLPVTALSDFVTDAFTDVRLVPRGSLGIYQDVTIDSADVEWQEHIRRKGVAARSHLDDYLANGPGEHPFCWYCQQLSLWEHDSFRNQGLNWLRLNPNACDPPVYGPGGSGGGTPYGN